MVEIFDARSNSFEEIARQGIKKYTYTDKMLDFAKLWQAINIT